MSYAHDEDCRCQRCTQSYCRWCDRPKPVGTRHLKCEDEAKAMQDAQVAEIDSERCKWSGCTLHHIHNGPHSNASAEVRK